MAAEIGSAYLSVLPSAKGFGKNLQAQVGPEIAGAGGKMGQSLGSRLSSSATSVAKRSLKAGLVAVVAGAGAVAGASLAKGFKRLEAIDRAEAKLRGLGHQASQVSKIIQNDVTAAVRGTAFGLDEAATTAAGAMAAGIKQGEQLTKYLKLTADAATIAGTSMSEMGSIMNKVQTSGFAMTDNLNQLADRGIPIFQWLQDEYKVSAAELRKMVSAGKVDAATFQKVIEENIGGAAQESGKTFSGALANMGAAMGRLGAKVLGGAFKQMPGIFTGITDTLDSLSPVAEKVGEKLGSGLTKIVNGGKALYDLLVKGDFTKQFKKTFGVTEDSGTVDFLFAIRDGVKQIEPAAKSLFKQAKPVFDLFLQFASGQAKNYAAIFKGIASAAKPLGVTFQTVLLPALTKFGNFLLSTGRTVVPVLLAVFKQVATVISTTVAPAISGFLQSVMKVVAVVLPVLQQVIGTVVNAIKSQLPVIMPMIQEIGAIFAEVFGFISSRVSQFAATFMQVWKVIGPVVLPILSTLIKTIIGIVGGLVKVVGGLVKLLVGIFTGDFSKMKAGVIAIFGGLKTVLVKLVSGLWSIIKTTFGGAVSWIMTKLGSWLSWNKTVLAGGLAKIKDWVLAPVRAARDGLGSVLATIRDKFSKAVDGFGEAWSQMKEKAKAPIRFVVETVLENGILGAFRKVATTVGLDGLADKMHVALPKGFARGGVIPGQSSMAGGDTHLRPMREGEGVLVSEGLRDPKSRGLFMQANAAARRGVSFAKFLLTGGFAKGGIVGGSGRFSKLFESRLLAASSMAGEVIQAFQRGFRPATSYSGTSHAGDAIDLQVSRKLLVALRSVGVAAWDRTGKGNWAPHIHGVPLPGAGHAGGSGIGQAQDYLRGGDGLGGRDNGPRVGVGANLPEGAGEDPGWLKIFTNPLQALKDRFSGPLNKLKEIGDSSLAQVVGGAAKHVASELVSAAPKILTALPGFARGTSSASRGLAWVGEQGPELMNFRGGEQVIPNKQSMALVGLAKAMSGAGRDVVAGLILGMGKNARKVQDAASDVAGLLVSTAKSELGIASPSKVFVQVGRWVNEGLRKGLTGSSAQVTATMKTLRTNMEKVWSDRKSTSKKGAVAYWQSELKRLRAAVKKTPKDASLKSALKSAEKNLAAARKGDTYAGVAAQWDRFAKRNKKITAALAKNAVDRAKIADRLKSAQAKLTDAVKVRDEFRAGVRDQAVQSANVVGTGSYAPDMIDSLKSKLSNWKRFGDNLAKLRKMGLAAQAYSEIVAAGPDEGNKAAEALLAGGSSSIRQVNELQKQIRLVGDKVGKEAAGMLYQPGVDAAQGLVDGLKKKQKALAKVGENLAKSIVNAVKKELKIKSPSRVMFAQGSFTGEGFVKGVESMQGDVELAASKLSTAAVPAVTGTSVEASRASSASASQPMQVYVQSPITGEYLLATIEKVTDSRIKVKARQMAGSRS